MPEVKFTVEFRNPDRDDWPEWQQAVRRFDTEALAEKFAGSVFTEKRTEWRVVPAPPRNQAKARSKARYGLS